jgi:hypothetical protein
MGPGGAAAPDINITRLSSTSWESNVGWRFGGDIERFEVGWTIQTSRTLAGGGDNIVIRSAAAVATAPATAFTAGTASVVAGDSAAMLVAQADGANAKLEAGSAASGVGGGAANGGDCRLMVGNVGANGGSAGRVVSTNKAGTAGADIVPIAASTGFVGTSTLKWAEVNAVVGNFGDVRFSDRTCVICNREFKKGDNLVMRVISIDLEGGDRWSRTVPAHVGCTH